MSVDLWNQIVLRWDSDANCAGLVKAGGIDAVWRRAGGDAGSAEAIAADAIRLTGRDPDGKPAPGGLAAIKAGVWPGVHAAQRGADGAILAGASQRAWIDANGWLAEWSKAFFPERPPVLAYVPDEEAGIAKDKSIAFDSLELALAEAWAAGGNYILAPDAPYRSALLKGEESAMAAWSLLGQTAQWLKANRSLFRGAPASAITILATPGDASAEIAALMFRHSGSPEVIPVEKAPAPDPARRPMMVAAGIGKVSAQLARLLLAHASSGATVFTDATGETPWWKVSGLKAGKQFEDRGFYTLGAGRIVAYKEEIADPGDFALDVLDEAGERRPVRLYDAPASVATVLMSGAGGAPVLHVVNYGPGMRGGQTMAHVRGVWRSATLLRPGEQPATLKTCRRGGNTEVVLPALRRLGVVVFGR